MSKYRKLNSGHVVVHDRELVLVLAGVWCARAPRLLGSAFITKEGWRILRYGLADIGRAHSVDQAVQRILNDHERQRPRIADLPASVRRELAPMNSTWFALAFVAWGLGALAVYLIVT